MMYYIVTGAAGFIGSKLVEGLNRRGIAEVIAVDNLAHADKFKNLAGCEIADYIDQAELPARLEALDFRKELRFVEVVGDLAADQVVELVGTGKVVDGDDVGDAARIERLHQPRADEARRPGDHVVAQARILT